MEKMALYLTDILLKNQIIDIDRKEIYTVGLELMISDIINFLLLLAVGLVTRSLLYSCIYSFMFLSVRRFSGGFHAKTYMRCRIVTIGTYLLILIASKILHNMIAYTVIFDIIAIITMFVFAPIRHPNKELTFKEIKVNKLLSLLTTLLFTAVSIILVVIGRNEGLIISLILFAIAILMYIGLLTNKTEGGEYNEAFK